MSVSTIIKVVKHNLIKKNNIKISLKSSDSGNAIVELYLCVILTLFPLYLLKDEFMYISGRVTIYFLLTLFIAIILILMSLKRQFSYRKYKYRVDYVAIVAVVLLLVHLVTKIAREDFSYEKELLFITVTIMYFIVSSATVFYLYYIDLILISSMFILLMALRYYFVSQDNVLLTLFVSNYQSMASFFVMISVISALSYCVCERNRKRIFYGFISILSTLLLCINSNPIGITIVFMTYLLIPVIYVPTAEIVKRDIQLLIMFLFVLSSVNIFVNTLDWLKIDVYYNKENSFYLDLVLVVICFLSFKYWDKIPAGVPQKEIVLKKVSKIFLFMLKGMGIFFFITIIAGNKLDRMSDTRGLRLFKDIAKKIQNYFVNNNGTFYDILMDYGMIGLIIMIICCCWIITRLVKNYNRSNETIVFLTVISIIYLVQTLFFSQQSITTPVYVIFLTFALFSNNTKIV